MKKTLKTFMLFAAALACVPVAANAAVVTKSFKFTATNFDVAGTPVSPPVDPVEGVFTITYNDEAILIPPTSAGLSIRATTCRTAAPRNIITAGDRTCSPSAIHSRPASAAPSWSAAATSSASRSWT